MSVRDHARQQTFKEVEEKQKRSEKRRGPLLDCLNKAHQKKPEKQKKEKKHWNQNSCGQFFITAKCKNGHEYKKQIICGKEYCIDCQKKGSVAHKRRISRWLDKVRRFDSILCIVITFPKEIRKNLKSKEKLKKIRKKIIGWLKKNYFYNVGLIRLHYFGETMEIEGNNYKYSVYVKKINGKSRVIINNGKCETVVPHKFKKTYDYCNHFKTHIDQSCIVTSIYNPHFNILVNGSYVKKEIIEKMRFELSNLIDIPLEKTNLNLKYYLSKSKKMHILQYILRSTFLDRDWDYNLSIELERFRNCVVWGSKKDWQKLTYKWDIEPNKSKIEKEIKKIFQEKICPCCGEKLIFEKTISVIHPQLFNLYKWVSKDHGILKKGGP